MGTLAAAAFGLRNGYKCVAQGDKTRGVVAGCQAISSVDSLASSSIFQNLTKGTGNLLAKTDGAVEAICSKVDKTGGFLDDAMKATGAGTKIGALAQKAVNPLLCISAGVRILKDDDQYARLIEETSAMGTMFAVESAMKYARSAVTGGAQATGGMAGLFAKTLGNSKVSGLMGKINQKYQALGGSANGSTKQLLVRLGLDALFVAGSILAYNAGQKIGTMLSHRQESKA